MAIGVPPLSLRIGPATVAGLAGAYVAGVAAVDPFRPRAIGCPVHELTGLWCPGCGSTRAVHELAHMDVVGSLACHPLVLPIVALLGWLWSSWVMRRRHGDARPAWARAPTELPSWLLVGLAVAFVALAVVRNIPGFEWTAPPTSP